MNRLEESFKTSIDLIQVIVLLGLNPMIRPIIAPELEKKLGRELVDWEWEYYLRESYRKAKVDYQHEIFRQLQQRLADMKIIHDFVWKPNTGRLRL